MISIKSENPELKAVIRGDSMTRIFFYRGGMDVPLTLESIGYLRFLNDQFISNAPLDQNRPANRDEGSGIIVEKIR